MEIEKNQEIEQKVGTNLARKFWLGTYIIVALCFLGVYILIRIGVLDVIGDYRVWLEKLSLAGFFSVLVLSLAKFIEILIMRRSETRFRRYNFVRLTRLMSFIAVIFLVISIMFTNWYAAAVSLGLISLILGFALQSPISSLIAWVYIIIRNPYHIGDRIQIEGYKGDVIEISYFDTTLWEIGGDYLTSDLPSGRMIRFPNSLVLQSAVYNYSWKEFEYIWNEISLYVAFESDIDYVEVVIRNVLREELGEGMSERIHELKDLVQGSPVDEQIIRVYPLVSVRTNANTWVEILVTYLVPPKKATLIRSAIIKRVLEELQKEPDKVMFPKSNMR